MTATAILPTRRIGLAGPGWAWAGRILPGLGLSLSVTFLAVLLAAIERKLFGAAWLEPLVLAILIGAAIRTGWMPGGVWTPGIHFSGKILLEIAVVLLGASVSAKTVLAAGPALLLGIAGVVALAIACGYAIGRLFGLPHRMATLVACGNAICGNSAIAAVAPAIGAEAEEVAASIAFTALFGVLLVLGLPILVPLLQLSRLQYGALAGLTVYAVPQVLAATAPAGAIAVQIGTLVKLMRVLMLGPVVLGITLLSRPTRNEPAPGDRPKPGRLPLFRLVPWFILGFLGLAALRSAGLVPAALLHPAAEAAGTLTVISMAALGLGTDLRVAARAGGRVTAVVTLSLLCLGLLGGGLIRLLGLD
ncbi:putative sulfate exporter family transporter [Acetobacteraceae bacterium KSS8]|uniref:Sulfate exporter family transporter n=1 Tax=Endosaccharibacter trunci TaxID=2812733 RepID=A0ABT1W3L6_9PROT|nr:putative sulfate exporter family transporter [Acetobacteraceae bacterium KSS8]